MQPFLAMIIPVSGDSQPPQPPLGIWGGANQPFPTPPIANAPGIPGYQPPRPPGVPTHPIYYPPGIWGGANQPFPTPPIYLPPTGGPPPLGIWGPTDPRPGYGLPGPQPHPEHPIVLPPDLPPETPEGGKIEWKTAWTPNTGWIVVGIPQEPHPVPSK